MSRVRTMIANRKQAAEKLPVRLEDRRMTLRLSGLTYGALLLIAGELEETPTGLAQDILTEALEDALQGIGYEDFSCAVSDIMELLEKNRKVHEVWDSMDVQGEPSPSDFSELKRQMQERGEI